MLGFLGKLAVTLFGSSNNGKSIVTEVSDTVDKWNPSEKTKHEMSIENQTAGDASQASAHKFIAAPSHESWVDILVDAMNRLPRPLFALWAFGILTGWWDAPETKNVDPIILNIIWTIITFYFGARTIFKDLPNAIGAFRGKKS